MPFTRRSLMAAGGALGMMALTSCGRDEQGSDSVTMIVPFAAGGGSDQAGRALADGLEAASGRSFSVENIEGGSGAIGYSEFLGMRGDSSKLLATETALVALPLTQDVEFSYRDFTPIFKAVEDYTLVVTRPEARYQTCIDLVERSRRESLLVGVSGVTGLDEIVFSLMEKDQGVKFDRVPYESGGEIIAALLGGHIEAASLNPSEVVGQLQAGELRALCALTPERFEFDELSHIPTGRELGIDVAFAQFRGVLAPGGIDEAAKAAWTKAARRHAQTREFRNYVEQNYLVAAPLFGDEFAEYFDTYNAELAKGLS